MDHDLLLLKSTAIRRATQTLGKAAGVLVLKTPTVTFE
jgi:hypothetical protein